MRWAVACAAMLLAPFAMSLLATSPAIGADEKSPAGVTVQENTVYGRVHGAGLLADIAYPNTKGPLPAIVSAHGGRWVGGHKRDASTIKVEQWAGFGFFAMGHMGINQEVIDKSLVFIEKMSAKEKP